MGFFTPSLWLKQEPRGAGTSLDQLPFGRITGSNPPIHDLFIYISMNTCYISKGREMCALQLNWYLPRSDVRGTAWDTVLSACRSGPQEAQSYLLPPNSRPASPSGGLLLTFLSCNQHSPAHALPVLKCTLMASRTCQGESYPPSTRRQILGRGEPSSEEPSAL